MPLTSRVLASATVVALAVAPRLVQSQAAQTLTGFASLPAASFAPGPTSGQFIAPANGVTPPFPGRQPIQGFSSVLRTSNGEFLAMSDNGFGSKATSPDYVLRVYRIAPDFKGRNGGSGSILVRSHISLRDPDLRINFPIVAEGDFYPGPPAGIPVDPAIKSQRLLTGGDFDIESLREANDGTLWFGDEFGPFLLHTDATGKVLEAPILLPGVQSPDNPLGGAPNLGGSRGFEGMAISPNGRTLYPMLEGPVQGDDPRTLRIYEFDLPTTSYTGRRWQYRLDVAGYSMGDLTAVTAQLFLVIERDQAQGAAAQFKKIFLVDLDDVDASGFLVKREVVNLLNLADPYQLAGPGPSFRFPFQTIEGVIPLSQNELGVLNDNNYPFSIGRNPPSPDPNEFILIRLDRPLQQFAKGKN
jgi:hypothetical protein